MGAVTRLLAMERVLRTIRELITGDSTRDMLRQLRETIERKRNGRPPRRHFASLLADTDDTTAKLLRHLSTSRLKTR